MELTQLRRRFRTAATPQDYRDAGNRCVAVLEAVSRTIYDPAVHLGAIPPSRRSDYVPASSRGQATAAGQPEFSEASPHSVDRAARRTYPANRSGSNLEERTPAVRLAIAVPSGDRM
jgi:hypothetical protein